MNKREKNKNFPLLSRGDHFNKLGVTLTGAVHSWSLQEKEHGCSDVNLMYFLYNIAIYICSWVSRIFIVYFIFLDFLNRLLKSCMFVWFSSDKTFLLGIFSGKQVLHRANTDDFVISLYFHFINLF